MADRLLERQKTFKQYKEDVRERGKPFYPYAMLHDTIMSLVVVCVIIVLAVIWKWTVPGHHTGTQAGWLGPLLDAPANPATFSFDPRPDWYFYFLFYLLRIFKWPASVFLGTVGIPTILLVILLLIPFIDRRAERRPLRRPVAMVASVLVVLSMGVLTWKGATAVSEVGGALLGDVKGWAAKEGYANNPQAVAGATLFATVGCTNCHTYLGAGQHNDGAPDLSAEGTEGRTDAWQLEHLKCPPCEYPGTPMPSFASQGTKNLKELVAFLQASKGPH